VAWARGFKEKSQVSTRLQPSRATKRFGNALLDDRSMMKWREQLQTRRRCGNDRNKRDRSAIVERLLSKLSPLHREVLDLVYYHEKSVDEVAQIVGAPANTVKTRMFYARKRMESLLKATGLDAH
jgi:RNA polymerase sigma factor (sigma-70 family)